LKRDARAKPMHNNEGDFLPAMIGILERLQNTSQAHGETLLASILAIAKVEAEDALRHANAVAALAARREETSSAHSWRAESAAADDFTAA
jgi:hypothetical protein